MTIPGLEAAIEAARTYYADHVPEWPDQFEHRVIHVETRHGRNHRIPGSRLDQQTLLRDAPLRLRCSTQSADGSLLEASLLAQSALDASRLASILVEDLGVPQSQVYVIRESPTRFHVVAGGVFRGLRPREAQQILAYLDPDSFRVQGPATSHRRRFQTHRRNILQELAELPRPRLQEALAGQAETHSHIEQAMATLQHPAPDGCPALDALVDRQALEATFPPYTTVSMIPVPLSIDARKQTVIKRIEVTP